MSQRYLHETLFIIGAGAHVPYSMPTGKQLREQIKKLYNYQGYLSLSLGGTSDPVGEVKQRICRIAHDLQIVDIARQNKAKREIRLFTGNLSNEEATIGWYNQFLKSFSESHVFSIDTYLSNLHTELDLVKREIFGQLGKLTIAYLIAKSECDTFLGTRGDDWIHHFIDMYLRKNPEGFFKAPPKLVTFNYDRIFERMLFTHLVEYHKYSPDLAEQKLDSLEIFHVYGYLGDYSSWPDHISKLDALFFRTAIDNIHVIGDERVKIKSADLKANIKNKFENSRCIYFLGYGFDEDNNKLLRESFGHQDWYQGFPSFATSIGIKRSDIARTKSSLGTTRMFRHSSAGEISELSCSDLMTEVSPISLYS